MSTETKWTPGPWKVGNLESYEGDTGIAFRMVYCEPESNEIQEAHIRGDNCDQNANLIAQAPRMYEALDEALEVLIDVAKTSGLTHSDAESVADNIWDVMAAARGGS